MSEWFSKQLRSIEPDDDDKYFEESCSVYAKTIEILAESISETCVESGILLRGLWQEYNNLVGERIDKAFTFAKNKDLQLNQIASKILDKYENSMKQNEEKYKEMKKQISDYEAEMEQMKAKLVQCKSENEWLVGKNKGVLEENSKLIRENLEIRDINKTMRTCFSGPQAEGAAGKNASLHNL